MAWMVRGTGEGLSVGAPFGWREWPMGLMVVRGRWGAREKVSWCFGCKRRREGARERESRCEKKVERRKRRQRLGRERKGVEKEKDKNQCQRSDFSD